jgi:hypothetical protein
MPDTSPILSLPYILPAQAQKHVTHNEAIRALDVMVQLSVQDRNLSAPPLTPVQGQRHIVAAGANGLWLGQAGKVAMFADGYWSFYQPLTGWRAHIVAEAAVAAFDGTVWKSPAEQPLVVQRLGVSATPDATNRLSVSADATLLNNAGAGHQLKLNKAASSDTASLLFQTGFSGRAEMGTSGSDNFSIKVSPNGSTFYSALSVDAATGRVSLPQVAILGGQASDPAGPSNGMMWLNTTSGQIKVQSAGATVVLATGGGAGVSDGDKGDVTVSGTGTVWTVDAGVVTNAKLATVATSTIKGRSTAGSGAPEDLTATQVRTLINVANGANNYVHPNHSGEVTSTADGATVIAAGVVSNAKLTTVSTATFKGRVTAGTGAPEDLTGVQAATLLPAFNATDKGLAPASGGGTTTFLRADGTWAVPAGGGGVTDGDKGDITVSGGGTVWSIDPASVSLTAMANLSTATIIGRTTAGTGTPEALSAATARALLGLVEPETLLPAAGEYMLTTAAGGGTTTGTSGGAANRFELFPYLSPGYVSIDQVAINCTTLLAAAQAKIVVYASDTNGRPDALLFESGVLDMSTLGTKTAAFSLSLEKYRLYWFGVRHSSTATVSAWAVNAVPDINGGTTISTAARKSIRRTLTFGTAAPTNFGFLASEITVSAPAAVWMRRV